jgi:hypothetical protein
MVPRLSCSGIRGRIVWYTGPIMSGEHVATVQSPTLKMEAAVLSYVFVLRLLNYMVPLPRRRQPPYASLRELQISYYDSCFKIKCFPPYPEASNSYIVIMCTIEWPVCTVDFLPVEIQTKLNLAHITSKTHNIAMFIMFRMGRMKTISNGICRHVYGLSAYKMQHSCFHWFINYHSRPGSYV